MNDNHQHIDDLVREQLQALPPATPPSGGWDALQRELDGDTDLLLRHALTGLAAGAAPAGWEALERKIDPQATADGQLAERLNGLSPMPPTGWEVLAARMDLENDEAVDAIVTDGLARTTPVATSGWAALAARLELIGWRRNTVAAWKITECCLLLSLLLLFVRFGPVTPSNPTFAELVDGFPIPLSANPDGDNETRKLAEREPVLEELSADLVKKQAPAATTVEKIRVQPTVSLAQSTPRSAVNADVRVVPPQPVPSAISANIASVTTDLEIAEATPPREDIYLPDNIDVLAINQLKPRLYPPSPALSLPKRDDSEPIYYYLNAFISPYDLNEVITPATEIGDVDISPDQRFTYGKSAGLMLDVTQGKNALQIGGIYARRSYIPTALKWYLSDEFPLFEPLTEFRRFVFESVDFQLNYKRTLIENSKWRFSSRMGMSLNIVAYSDFVGKDAVIDDLNDRFEGFESGAPSPPGANNGRSSNAADKKRLVDPPNGWWEGGSALENSTLYFNGGFVMERLMNDRWSIYVSPSFSRVVYLKKDQGIGPFKDRINPIGVRLGSRYHFGGK